MARIPREVKLVLGAGMFLAFLLLGSSLYLLTFPIPRFERFLAAGHPIAPATALALFHAQKSLLTALAFLGGIGIIFCFGLARLFRKYSSPR